MFRVLSCVVGRGCLLGCKVQRRSAAMRSYPSPKIRGGYRECQAAMA